MVLDYKTQQLCHKTYSPSTALSIYSAYTWCTWWLELLLMTSHTLNYYTGISGYQEG